MSEARESFVGVGRADFVGGFINLFTGAENIIYILYTHTCVSIYIHIYKDTRVYV